MICASDYVICKMGQVAGIKDGFDSVGAEGVESEEGK